MKKLISILVVYSLVFNFLGINSVSAISGTTLAYWTLDGNSNDSVASFNGTDTGITYNASYGKINQGISFNSATSRIAIPDSATFDTNGMAVSFWMKKYGTAPTNRHTMFITKGAFPSAYNSDWMVARSYVGADIFFAISRNSDRKQQAVSLPSGATLDGSWHHVVCQWTPSVSLECFVDSVSVATFTTGVLAYLDHAYDIQIGDHTNGCSVCDSPYGWVYMDEIAVYNAPLSQTDIDTIYNAGTGLQYPFTAPAGAITSASIIMFE